MQYKIKTWSEEHSKNARIIRSFGLSLFTHWLPGPGFEFDYITVKSDTFSWRFSTPRVAKTFLKSQNII